MKSFNPPSKALTSCRANAIAQRATVPAKSFVDNRPQAVKQRKLQEEISSSLASKLTIQRVVDGNLAIGSKVKVIDPRKFDAGKVGTIKRAPAQHGWTDHYEVEIDRTTSLYSFKSLDKYIEDRLPVDGSLAIGSKVTVTDNRRNDAGKIGTIVRTPAQHGWTGSYEINLGDKVEYYSFNGLTKAPEDEITVDEIPDDKFNQLFDEFKTNLNKDDKLLGTLKRTASVLRAEDMPEIDQWRKNKKARIQVDLDGTSRTLQGTGYFVKGGKSYQEELISLREEMEEDYPGEVDVAINILMQEEILMGKRYESNYPIANSIGAITNTGETARASFNQIESEMALRIPANSGVDPIELFKIKLRMVKA